VVARRQADRVLRERPGGTTIQLVSALGGADRKLSDFRGADSIAWSPDGHWLAAGRSGKYDNAGQPRGIYLVPVDGGDPRPLIASTPGVADSQPAFSPDGRRLAYASCSHSSTSVFAGGTGGCDISLIDLNAARAPSAPPRRLTTQRSLFIDAIAWTRDGSAVVYAAAAAAGTRLTYLWRVAVYGTRPPERIEVAGAGATAPAMALSRDRLAFTRASRDADVYRFEVGRPAQLLVGSTFVEMEPRLSPDGRRVVFVSQRSGATSDIWVAEADGSNAQQLTHGPGRAQGSPFWSPDGRRIAFASARLSTSHPARSVWRCRPKAEPSCIRD
jgi:Tol biopolymer transport system component